MKPIDYPGGIHGYRLIRLNDRIASKNLVVKRQAGGFALFLGDRQLTKYLTLKKIEQVIKDNWSS
jgi:hypothetical protein